jgi:broad specificity phosphatase PhoE
MRSFVASDVVAAVDEVWSSAETKAIEAANLLAARFSLPVEVDPDLGENDRSATGFVPPDEFERMANDFFARPTVSVRGWETAQGAQVRVVAALNRILSRRRGVGDLAILAHGGIGTLLLCSLLGAPISREMDQPFQGHYFAFEPATTRVLHGWKAIAPR